jgi:molecular chaperone GrpE
MTQNTQTKMTDESLGFVEEVDVFDPSADEAAGYLRDELEAERDKYLRLAAEYKNYRRRTEKENAEAADKGKRDVLIQLVSLADDLDLALAGLNESSDTVAEGVRMIHRRFRGILETNTVIPFDSVGEKFDPELHEAFAVTAAAGRESGTVHEEMRRGYFWNGKLLRPAMVVVTK